MPVDTPRSDYSIYLKKWTRLRDCNNGRDAILAAGPAYVPNLKGLDSAANDDYRARGNFLNAVARTNFGMVGMLFSKDMETKFPTRFEDMLKDVTLTSVSHEMFAFTTATETLLMGRYGILVDMDDEGVPPRPYLVGYTAEQIINWSVERYDGDGVLTQVVLKEAYEEPKDEFTRDECIQYRVLSLKDGVYQQDIWRKPKGQNDYVLYYEEGRTEPIIPLRRGKPLDFIPFVFLGPLHVTCELVKPPLLDLADVNLGHWRNSVDYEHGLHLVALPTPWVAGMKAPQNPGEPMKIGPSVIWELDLQGSAGMLEFAGTGLKAIFDAMEDKKKQMAMLGAQLLEEVPKYAETATGVAMRHAGEHATLKTLAVALGQGISMALQMLAWWMDTAEKPEDVDASIEINKDFLNVKISAQDVQAALQSVQAGKMSFETYWHLLSTGGWGRDGVTAEEEQKQIDKEEPALPEVNPLDTLDANGNPVPAPAAPPSPPGKPKKKVVTGPDGKVKYQVTEE